MTERNGTYSLPSPQTNPPNAPGNTLSAPATAESPETLEAVRRQEAASLLEAYQQEWRHTYHCLCWTVGILFALLVLGAVWLLSRLAEWVLG